MSYRNNDEDFLTWLRSLQNRISSLERDAGTKQNDLRLGNWIVKMTDAGCPTTLNVHTSQFRDLCG